ncbi:hypothetical protein [Paracidovorax anthurii]|uniref:Uncharacterized protein n=1 Tax=Paracidovorax anthurii TaxID=78229 RepID=A0A328ZF70_9BURK|nr:hypothetical protein [Paracidovorax anthurii]RAR85000.1 hypothetical protein AX018_100893 [Paracidovorax anthurii]
MPNQPKPRSLVAAMLADEAAKRRARPAADALADVPEIVDVAAWYSQHTALLHQFLHHAIKRVAAAPVSKQTQRVIHSLGQTHADLMAHTVKIAGPSVPRVLARDGKHSIPYERLAEARAKVQVLTEELAYLQALEEWHPRFEAMSAKQEALAAQFANEIAAQAEGDHIGPGPTRLLEMARQLYEAEREELAP